MLIKRCGLNTQGRDFVVGDIHGTYEYVVTAMKAVSFNMARDRLFVVGDLVDRGRESHRALAFLRQPFVHAVRGNHEDMLLSLYPEGEPAPDEAILKYLCNSNGMEWWLDYDADKRLELIAEFRQLPLVIEVETARGMVGLLHAEVPIGMDWPLFVERIDCGDMDVIHSCLWGRTRTETQCLEKVEGIGRIFAGHTPQFDGARVLGNHVFIDSGAVFKELGVEPRGHLTSAELIVTTMKLANGRQSQGPVEVKMDLVPFEGAFGTSMVGKCNAHGG